MLDGPKLGFNVPFADWLRTSLRSQFLDHLATFHRRQGDLLDRAVVENVREVLMAISKRSPALAGMAAKGELKIVGARYDLDSGAVTPVTAGK